MQTAPRQHIDAEQGAKALVASLSSYRELTAHLEGPVAGADGAAAEGAAAEGPSKPRWLTDAVVAIRMQFLLSILVPCTPHFGQVRYMRIKPGLTNSMCSVSSAMNARLKAAARMQHDTWVRRYTD